MEVSKSEIENIQLTKDLEKEEEMLLAILYQNNYKTEDFDFDVNVNKVEANNNNIA